MNFTDRLVASVTDHLLLVVALALALWWVLKTFGPRAVKMSLENGGGEVLQRHMEVALLRQDVRIQSQMRDLIKDHEQVEERNLRARLDEMKDDLRSTVDDLSSRLARVEARRWF